MVSMSFSRNFLFLIFVFLFFAPFVSSYNATVPVDVKVNVDFISDRNFVIRLPYGFERFYSWNETATPPNDVFSHKIFFELDPQRWCGENTALYQYKNLTTTFADLSNVCRDSMAQYVVTVNALSNVSDVEKKFVSCNSELMSLQERLSALIEKEKNYERMINDYVACQNSLAFCKGDQDKLVSCVDDFEKCSDDKILFGAVGGLAGLLIGWFLWKKEKKGVIRSPSEQEGLSGGGDFVGVSPDSVARRSDGKSKNVWDRFDKEEGGRV